MAEYICRVSLGVPLITHVRWSASRIGVAGQAGVEEAQPLFLADHFDAGGYLLRRLAHSAVRQLVVGHALHLDMYTDAMGVEQGAGHSLLVAGDRGEGPTG